MKADFFHCQEDPELILKHCVLFQKWRLAFKQPATSVLTVLTQWHAAALHHVLLFLCSERTFFVWDVINRSPLGSHQ